MSDACTSDCATCGESCSQRRQDNDFMKAPHPKSKIRNIIGVVSGKGGVGKSLVTSLLAVNSQRAGFSTAILDADITGPSIPKAFGITGAAQGNQDGLLPSKSSTGIKVMSVNLLLENPDDPVVWRGPVIAGTVQQFWTDVVWGDVDFMFVDLPPGTGDVPLTVFQSLPLSGIIIVTTPQQLVTMIVKKAVKMAGLMDIPILGLVENMAYATCPHCGEEIPLFGESRLAATAGELGIETTGRLPINPALAAASDAGNIEAYEGTLLPELSAALGKLARQDG